MIFEEIYPPDGSDISMVTETDEVPALSLSHACGYDAGSSAVAGLLAAAVEPR